MSIAPPADSTASVAGRTPGQELLRALIGCPSATVELPVSLPATFPFFATRPRYTVRHLLGTAPATTDPVAYVAEPPAPGTPAQSGTSYAVSPEATFEPRLDQARLTSVRAVVPIPPGLTDHPDLFTAYVDRRVVVRLCTVENEVLLHGTEDGAIPGLLPACVRRVPGRGDGDLAWAAALVEETGGSCDGAVVHPDLYWALVADGRLARLTEAGVRVSRTRMIARGLALLGDFRAVATLLDPARSRLTLRDHTIEASEHIGLAIHLPQHLVLVEAP